MYSHVITLANSIIGVSVLAMPFCFKQCGVILSIVMLLLGAILTRIVCYFLIKAGLTTRRRTYELLAYHIFGSAGKFLVEITIIGFLLGTLVAFLVVIGDLGPDILYSVFSIENSSSLRSIIMTALALFVALPLGLLRNIDSLNSVSTASILFYSFLVCKILSEGLGTFWSGSYIDKIDYWRPAGVLQCIPIFAMALSCQTQIFGIYEILPDPSLKKMNQIVKNAVNAVTLFYICVGFFGYITFCTQSFGGNILLNFNRGWSTQMIKICFVLSTAFSFPLIIFPLRASLNSLIFRRGQMHHLVHDISTNYIPESRLKSLTVLIVTVTLCLGLVIPNIEFVLGIVGSTTGSIICIIFPSVMFIRVTPKNTTERLLAQLILAVGICIMVLSTYVTLFQIDSKKIEEYNSGQLTSEEKVTQIYVAIPKDLIKSQETVSKTVKSAINLGFEPKTSLRINEEKEKINDKIEDTKMRQAIQPDDPISNNEIKSESQKQNNDNLKDQNINNNNNEAIINQAQAEAPKEMKTIEEPEKINVIKDIKLGDEIINNNVVEDHQKALVSEDHDNDEDQRDFKNDKRKEKEKIDKRKKLENEIEPDKKYDKYLEPQSQDQDNAKENIDKVDDTPIELKKESENKKNKEILERNDNIEIENKVKKDDDIEENRQEPVDNLTNNKKEYAHNDKVGAEEILKKLEKQQEQQKKIIEEQKNILEDLKKHQAEHKINQYKDEVQELKDHDQDSLKNTIKAIKEREKKEESIKNKNKVDKIIEIKDKKLEKSEMNENDKYELKDNFKGNNLETKKNLDVPKEKPKEVHDRDI